MKHLIVVIAFLVGCAASVLAEGERKQTGEIKIGTEYTYHSEFMDEDIQYKVSLPYYYDLDPTKKFPVIYVLDGHIPNVKSVSTIAGELWGQGHEMPDVIVIGIPSNDRRRDYTPIATDLDHNGEKTDDGYFLTGGGAPKYKEFLKQDFIPHIEQLYRTNGHRILIGHSLGGLFVLHDVMSKDKLFQSYIAVDPALWFAGDYILDQFQNLPDHSIDYAGNLYVSVALRGLNPSDETLERGKKGKRERFRKLKELLEMKSTTKFSVKVEEFLWEDHGSVVVPTHRAGLRHVFDQYLPFQNVDPLKSLPAYKVAHYFAENPGKLALYYGEFSNTVGAAYLPDQRLVEFAIYAAINKKMYNNAYKLVQLNLQNHPELAYSWVQLGEYYEAVEDKPEALKAYQRALELDEEDSWAKSKVMELSE